MCLFVHQNISVSHMLWMPSQNQGAAGNVIQHSKIERPTNTMPVNVFRQEIVNLQVCTRPLLCLMLTGRKQILKLYLQYIPL